MEKASIEERRKAFAEALALEQEADALENPRYYAEVCGEHMRTAESRAEFLPRFLSIMFAGPHGWQHQSASIRRACKRLGIKHTRKSIIEFLHSGA